MDKALVFGTKDCRFESCQVIIKVILVTPIPYIYIYEIGVTRIITNYDNVVRQS